MHNQTRTRRAASGCPFFKRFVVFAVKMSTHALEAKSNENVVEEVCSPTEEFDADPAYTSNDLCAAAGRITRLERDIVELRGDSALDRAYLRGLASFVCGEQDNAIESLRSQMRALQGALQDAVAYQQRVSGL